MIGKTISHYRILEKLGGGGMGVVYKAKDLKLDRFVALKFLPPTLSAYEDAKKRFIHEAKAASALDHSNICNVHEIDETEDGQLFIVMAYYDGETLKNKITKGPLDVQNILNIALQIVQGLLKAHEHDIVHRDIKSANIMITSEGTVKIVDFGLAKLSGTSKITKLDSTLGTISYMSPEQARGDIIDLRTDIWSVGVVLYEMLTGNLPFKGEYDQAVVYSILNSDPKPLNELIKDISPEIEKIVNKCLQKEPGSRYQNMTELENDLQSARMVGKLEIPKYKRNIEHVVNVVRKRGYKYLIPLTILILVFGSLFIIPSTRNYIQTWVGVAVIPEQKYLAILPFANIGEGQQNKAFCDGLVETIAGKLTQLQASNRSLWIVAVNEIRERDISSVTEARKAFGITLGVTGSVQREEDQVRLIMNLVDAKTSRQLRSTVTDELGVTLSDLQDKAVQNIVEMLQLELSPGDRGALTSGGTKISKAFDYYIQAKGYLQRFEKLENLTIAISLFKKALEEDSLYAEAYSGLGEAFWRMYDESKDPVWISDAVENCNRSLDLNSQLASAHVTLGLINKGTGEYENAIIEFKKAIENNPVNADAFRELGGAYERFGKIELAEDTYKKAINLSRAYWASHNRLGVFYYRQGRYEDAVEQFKIVVELTPDNFKGYNNLGGLYFYLNHWSEAEEMFKKSIDIEPNYTGYSQLGTLLYYRRQYKEATKAYESALALLNTDYRVWGNLGSAYFWIADTIRAKKTFQEAVRLAEIQRELNPRDGVLLCDLAGYYQKLGMNDSSRQTLEEALALSPNDVDVMGRAGTLFELLGDRDSALKWIEEALKNDYSFTEIENDPQLENFRNDKRFKKIMSMKH